MLSNDYTNNYENMLSNDYACFHELSNWSILIIQISIFRLSSQAYHDIASFLLVRPVGLSQVGM